MKNFELTLRTFLLTLVTVLTLQHAQQVPIRHIALMYAICAVCSLLLMILFKITGLTEGLK